MTDRDPKKASPESTSSEAGQPVVHRVVESERSLAARARAADDPPAGRSTVRLLRPELPKQIPPSPSTDPAVYRTTTLIMAPIVPSTNAPPDLPPPGTTTEPEAVHAHAMVHVPRVAERELPPDLGEARMRLISNPTPLDPRLILIAEPESARAVAFRLLRDTLLSKELPRVLAVAGTAAQDGATTCAVNIALALAEHAETRVLLMDANFAAPSLARIFSIDGFGPANEALSPLKLAALMPRLHVAAIVRRSADAAPRFDKLRYQNILELLASQDHDYIVIDAGALRPGSPAAQLVTVADATLLAVRAGRTTARALRRAGSQIPPGRAIGVTLVDDEPTHE